MSGISIITQLLTSSKAPDSAASMAVPVSHSDVTSEPRVFTRAFAAASASARRVTCAAHARVNAESSIKLSEPLLLTVEYTQKRCWTPSALPNQIAALDHQRAFAVMCWLTSKPATRRGAFDQYQDVNTA